MNERISPAVAGAGPWTVTTAGTGSKVRGTWPSGGGRKPASGGSGRIFALCSASPSRRQMSGGSPPGARAAGGTAAAQPMVRSAAEGAACRRRSLSCRAASATAAWNSRRWRRPERNVTRTDTPETAVKARNIHMPVRNARPTPTRSGSTAASAMAARWPGAAVPRTTSGAATLEPASNVTASGAARGTPDGPSRSEIVESPQRIEDAVVTGAVRTLRPSTLVPFALPRSMIVTAESATSRRACSRESSASGITTSVPARPIRNLSPPQGDQRARAGTAVHGEQQRGSVPLARPGAECRARSRHEPSKSPAPSTSAAPSTASTFNQHSTLDQGRHANGHDGDRSSPDRQLTGPVAPGDGSLQVRARARCRGPRRRAQ